MRAPHPCGKTDPHPPHFYRIANSHRPQVISCGGVDPAQALAPERDRPAPPDFDWTPEEFHLSEAAAMVARTYSGESPAYPAMVALWAALCGMDEAESLTYAFSIATAVPAVTAACAPF